MKINRQMLRMQTSLINLVAEFHNPWSKNCRCMLDNANFYAFNAVELVARIRGFGILTELSSHISKHIILI